MEISTQLDLRRLLNELYIKEAAMPFLVQFRRCRRGVPVVIGTLPVAAADATAALAFAQSSAGRRRWPARTDALCVMDDGGRMLVDWTVPVETPQPATYPPRPRPTNPAGKELRPAPLMATESTSSPIVGTHRFAVGQAVSYAEGGRPEVWKGGYEILRLEAPHQEPQYVIRSADQSYDRIVHEHELREDLGARGR